ncbi:hypothetical protein V491_02756 [Pseudogymnoascus sp. VKM F-3775]|nr:hypothetical protein V491_02756 [Pseudogymnoascus sp. VKM F-3775]
MPVFTNEWKRPFDRRNHRSRQPRFLESREKVSGFTAVFCHDWRDDDSEEDDELLVTPELETNMDVFPNPIASARSLCEYKEPYNPFKAATASSSTHPMRQKYIFKGYVPPTSTVTNAHSSPPIMPTYDKKIPTERRKYRRYTTQSLFDFENPVPQNNVTTTDEDELAPSGEDIADQYWLSGKEEGVTEGGGFEHWRSFLERHIVA